MIRISQKIAVAGLVGKRTSTLEVAGFKELGGSRLALGAKLQRSALPHGTS